jgi:integral membrane sensor domain MASE1
MHWPNPANPSEPEVAEGSVWPGFGPALALAGSVFLAGVLGIALTRQSGRVAAIWLANAVVVLALLGSPRRRWPVLLLCGLAGNLAADRVLGDGSWMAFALSLCNTVEIVLAGWLFRLWDRHDRTDLTRMPSLFKFIAVAGLAAPATGAALAAVGLHLHQGTPFGMVWRPWYAADALGLLILVPLLAMLDRTQLRSQARSALRPPVLAGLALIPALTLALVVNNQLGWLFLLSPVILWAVFKEGFAGATLAIFLAAASAIVPLAALASRPEFAPHLRADIFQIQVFLFTLVVIFLPIANLLRALQDGDAQFRILIEQAPEAILVYDLDRDRFIAANRSAEKLFGCPRDQLLESGPRRFLQGIQEEREFPARLPNL